MKKLKKSGSKLLAFLLALALLFCTAAPAMAYEYQDIGLNVGTGSFKGWVTVQSQQDFEAWYADFMENGNVTTGSNPKSYTYLVVMCDLTISGEYDLTSRTSEYGLGVNIADGRTLTIQEGASLTAHSLVVSKSHLVNDGTLILTSDLADKCCLQGNGSSTGAFGSIVNNGVIKATGECNTVDNWNPSDGTNVFTNNGVIYTKDGTLNFNPEIPTEIGNIERLPISAPGGSQTGDVKADYVRAAATEVYSVDVTWGSMEFVYTDQGRKWNTETHKWEEDENRPGQWARKEGSDDSITLKNDSSAAVNVSFSFAAEGGYTGLTGGFACDGAALTAPLTLEKPTEDMPAREYAVTFTPSGSIPSSHPAGGKIGTITVALSEAGGD